MKKLLFITILFCAMLFGGIARAEDGKCKCDITDVKTKVVTPAQPVKLIINNEANCAKKNGEIDLSSEYANCVWIPAAKPPAKTSGATSPTTPSAPTGPGVPAPAGTSAMPEETKLVNPLGGTEQDPKGLVDVRVILGNIIKTGLGIIGSLTLVMFLYGGFLWLISAGNAEQVKKGTQTMLWAVIGIFIIFGSYGILTLVLQSIGAKNTADEPWGLQTVGGPETQEGVVEQLKSWQCLPLETFDLEAECASATDGDMCAELNNVVYEAQACEFKDGDCIRKMSEAGFCAKFLDKDACVDTVSDTCEVITN